MSDIEYWIWFSSLRHLRSRTRRALLERFGTAKELYFAERTEIEKLDGIRAEEVDDLLNRDLRSASTIIGRCAELDVRIVTIQDAIYPERLRNIPDPPYVLYVLGHLPAIDSEPVIGIVGTRKSTPYGDKMARSIAGEIAAHGGIVATGLAAGIDSRAAEGALMAGGKVIGVLGVAINDVYPKGNGKLYADVKAAGALVSEYPPDAKGGGEWFPRRNRIIAGLSVGVAVAEAPLRSGALITAHLAADYGRDVYAVPGNADAANSKGVNNLLREGASLAERGWDILQEYESRFPDKVSRDGKHIALPPPETGKKEEAQPEEKTAKGFLKFRVRTRKDETAETSAPKLKAQLDALNENQLKIVGVMSKPKMHVDDIVDLSRLPASTVLSELTMLQIKGFVSQEPGKRFTLNIAK